MALANRIEAGVSIDTIAEELGLQATRVDSLRRTSTSAALSSEAIAEIFDLARDDVTHVPGLSAGARLLVVLEAVNEPDIQSGESEIALMVEGAASGVSNDLVALFQQAALEEREFEIRPAGIEYAINPHAGPHGGY